MIQGLDSYLSIVRVVARLEATSITSLIKPTKFKSLVKSVYEFSVLKPFFRVFNLSESNHHHTIIIKRIYECNVSLNEKKVQLSVDKTGLITLWPGWQKLSYISIKIMPFIYCIGWTSPRHNRQASKEILSSIVQLGLIQPLCVPSLLFSRISILALNLLYYLLKPDYQLKPSKLFAQCSNSQILEIVKILDI